MTEYLRQVLRHVREESAKLSPEEQDALAHVLVQIPIPLPAYAGSMPDLPEDIEEDLLQRRREVPPTPLMDEQLHELLEDDA